MASTYTHTKKQKHTQLTEYIKKRSKYTGQTWNIFQFATRNYSISCICPFPHTCVAKKYTNRGNDNKLWCRRNFAFSKNINESIMMKRIVARCYFHCAKLVVVVVAAVFSSLSQCECLWSRLICLFRTFEHYERLIDGQLFWIISSQ